MKETIGIWFQSINTTQQKAEEGLRFCLNNVEFLPGKFYLLILSSSGFGIFQNYHLPPHTCFVASFDGSDVHRFHDLYNFTYTAGRIVSLQPRTKTFQELLFRRYNV